MRILLVIPQSNYPAPPPCLDLVPQGPAYVAGALGAAGHQVRGVVTSFDLSGEPAPQVLTRRFTEALAEFEPQLIFTGGMAPEFLFLRDVVTLARQHAPDVPLVLGGSIVSNDPQIFDLLGPDIGVRGEAEQTVVELAQRMERGDALEPCAGLILRRQGQRLLTDARPAPQDLDTLALPDYEPLGIHDCLAMQNQRDNYFHVRTRTNPRLLPISAGRSCPHQCTFCQYSQVEGVRRRYRRRAVAAVIDEIVHFHQLYRFNILKIYDDLFATQRDRVLEFCQAMRDTGLDIDWNASMRVTDVKPELLAEMKAAGCVHIGYGFESANQGVLDSMNKRITPAQIERAVALTEEAGIGVQGNFIYGDPAETAASVQQTLAFYSERCHQHIVHHDYVMPYPGSPIFDRCLERGVITSRQHYYETIHRRPRYNMTGMSQRQFHASVEPVVREKLGGLRHALQVRHSLCQDPGFEHAFFDQRVLVQVDALCPHCEREVQFVFPTPQHELAAGGAPMLAPLRFFCHHCHRRLLVSMLQLIGLRAPMADYVRRVAELIRGQQTVVLAPMMGHEVIDACRGHGLELDQLNLQGVLYPGPVNPGMEFLGAPVLPFALDAIERRLDAHFVVLPCTAFQEIVDNLLKVGVAPDRLLYMPWPQRGSPITP